MFVLDRGKRFVIPRTELTYPGHNMKLHQNAADPVKSPVDHVMMDLEDACPYEFKGPKSRQCVVEALNTLDFGKKVITVRPNNMRSEFFLGDMQAIVLGAPDKFHGIILPKVHGPDDIKYVSSLLDNLEKQGGWKTRMQIESLIEIPQALVKAYEIAMASDRMAGLILHCRLCRHAWHPRGSKEPEPQLPLCQAGSSGRGQGRRLACRRQRLPTALA